MWEERFSDHKEAGDCLELALSSHVVENNFMFGGGGDGCFGHEEETKLNMISLAWDPSIQGSSNSCRSTLSLAHGFMDKMDDDMSMVNEDHISLSSFHQQAQVRHAAAATDHYPSLASEEDSTWCSKDALINTSSMKAHFNNSEPKPDQRSVDLMLNLSTEFPAEAAAIGESSWIGSRRLKEWPPKFAAIKHIKAKDSYDDQLDRQALDYGVGSRTATRVCVDCKTTKTPLWRSGPKGPKSLCNACGIRYRKARRALSAFGNTDHMAAVYNSRLPKRKQIEERVDKFVHLKKRSRLSIPSYKKNINVKFNGNPRVFAEDEKEAAVLLMALSCGLVHV